MRNRSRSTGGNGMLIYPKVAKPEFLLWISHFFYFAYLLWTSQQQWLFQENNQYKYFRQEFQTCKKKYLNYLLSNWTYG